MEKEIATHSSILAWKIPGPRSLVGYSPWGHKESDTTEGLHLLSPILKTTDYVNSLTLLVGYFMLLTKAQSCLFQSFICLRKLSQDKIISLTQFLPEYFH